MVHKLMPSLCIIVTALSRVSVMTMHRDMLYKVARSGKLLLPSTHASSGSAYRAYLSIYRLHTKALCI